MPAATSRPASRRSVGDALRRSRRTGSPIRRAVAAGRPADDDDFWYQDANTGIVLERSGIGARVTPSKALTMSRVYRAVALISRDIAALPLRLVRALPDRENGLPGGKERVRNPLDAVLSGRRVNADQTPFQWREMVLSHLLLRGDHYSVIEPGRSGFVGAVRPLAPERVQCDRLDNGRKLYIHTDAKGRQTRFVQDEVFHVRGFNPDPENPCGLSIVSLARRSLALTEATEEFGARQFTQTPRPSFVIKIPGKLEKEDRRDFEDSFRRQWSGQAGWGGAPVLQNGAEAVPVGMSHDDAQFLETRRFQVDEIACWFGIPPHMLASMERATFSNIEQQSLEYVTHSLLPWIVLFEQCIERDLLAEDEPDVEAEFVLDGLLRGDSLARAQAYQLHANMKTLTPNEIRHLEGRNPVPWGDKPLETQGAPASPIPRASAPAADLPPNHIRAALRQGANGHG